MTGWQILLGVAGSILMHDLLAFYGLAYSVLVLGNEFHWWSYTDNPLDILRIAVMPVVVVVACKTIQQHGGFARHGWAVSCSVGAICFVCFGGPVQIL